MECIILRDGVLTATYNGFSNLKIEEDSKEPGSVLIFSKSFSLKNKGFRVLKKRKKRSLMIFQRLFRWRTRVLEF